MISAVPIFFGGLQHLFGWFAQGRPENARQLAVLLCPPLGHEHLCSYRAFRELGDRLADAGFAVLRFDYFGTGNSGGTPTDSGLVGAWQQSVTAGADELRRLSGCDRLAFVGLRFGATLAYTSAAERDDVDSVVLWSPCTNGRSFARQARMLAIASTERPDELIPASEGLEAAGFHFSAETVADMSRMDMLSLGKPANRALLLTGDDASRDEILIEHLGASGVAFDERRFTGYSTFMVSPLHSILPTAAIAEIAGWLEAEYPSEPDAPRPAEEAALQRQMQLSEGTVQEQAVTFASGRLFGIMTEPVQASDAAGAELPSVVLLNTGADHHVGPHRLYVPLAREWARRGFRVLRFDLPGIGDSELNVGAITTDSYPETALDDVRAAVAYLRESDRTGEIVLAGMCSGAFHAVHSAGLPVSGIIAVNPPLYWTPGDPIDSDPYFTQAETKRLRRSLLSPAKWERLLRGDVDVRYNATLVVQRVRNVSIALLSAIRGLVLGDAPSDAARQAQESLFPAETATSLIFSSGDPALTYFQQTLRTRLPELSARGNFTIDVIAGADHTFMPLKWQRQLAQLMTDRLMERYAPSPTATH